MHKQKSKNTRLIIISIACHVLSIPLIVIPLVTAIVYECIFYTRYETPTWRKYSIEDFEGLSVERSDFESNGVTLAGYKYSKEEKTEKGVVILAHGLGGGGHNSYMPFIDVFTSNGYFVFTYDARGNDESEGRSVRGLPQGVIDLDSAICHAKEIDEYQDLPMMLFGHSWGAYSAATVLNIHPEIDAAVIIAGFNESEDMMKYQAEKRVGEGIVNVLFSYVELYEELKFGKEFTEITAIEGLRGTDADIMIVHSRDDEIVPSKYGYEAFYGEFSESERFEFVLYEDKGHDYVLYSEESLKYREALEEEYDAYRIEHHLRNIDSVESAYMEEHLDKFLCFEPDPELTEQILLLFEKSIKD